MSTTSPQVEEHQRDSLERNQYPPHRWSLQRAREWYEQQDWIVGCNYLPATAVNQLEMWQDDSFDPFTVHKELDWAAALGFNTIRVFLHHLVWQQNPQGYLRRLDQFLFIASKCGIKTMPVLFDSVWNPYPKQGKQSEPRFNVHNSGWVQCPGYEMLNDPARHNELKSYVQGIVSQFKNDERVLLWDLYNEPDNTNLTSYSDDYYVQPKEALGLQLLKKTLRWVRSINPIQPVTMAPWRWMDIQRLSELDRYMFNQSDVISFHCYENKEGMEKRILSLKQFGRPLICTEYMARPLGSTLQEILPLLKKYHVGAFNWGLVQGKSQTHCAWNSWQVAYDQEPEVWFHDLLRSNGEPYDQKEIAFLNAFNSEEMMEVQKIA